MKPLIYIALGALAFWYFTRRRAPSMPFSAPDIAVPAAKAANNLAPISNKISADIRALSGPRIGGLPGPRIGGLTGF